MMVVLFMRYRDTGINSIVVLEFGVWRLEVGGISFSSYTLNENPSGSVYFLDYVPPPIDITNFSWFLAN
jgi:hypothetical protein